MVYIADSRVSLQAVRALVRPPTEALAAAMAFLYLAFSAFFALSSDSNSAIVMFFSSSRSESMIHDI